MPSDKLKPLERTTLEAQRDAQGAKQPYAAEVDDRELERAHREERPTDPAAGAPTPAPKRG